MDKSDYIFLDANMTRCLLNDEMTPYEAYVAAKRLAQKHNCGVCYAIVVAYDIRPKRYTRCGNTLPLDGCCICEEELIIGTA